MSADFDSIRAAAHDLPDRKIMETDIAFDEGIRTFAGLATVAADNGFAVVFFFYCIDSIAFSAL